MFLSPAVGTFLAAGEPLLLPGDPEPVGVPLGPEPHVAATRAAGVVASLDLLTERTSRLLTEIVTSQQHLKDLRDQLAALRDRRDHEMEDYRSGLFCSGCNRTKTDILAKGESFPHPGQQVIQPTTEQIAAKEREFQPPIDELENRIRRAERDLAALRNRREEALWQITQGFDLWHNCVFFENTLRSHREGRAQADFLTHIDGIDDSLRRLEIVNRASLLKDQQARLDAEVAKLRQTREAASADRARSHQRYQEAQAVAAKTAGEQAGRLNDYVVRGLLKQEITLIAKPEGRNAGPQSGVHYRMGDFTPERHGEVLPDIARLIAGFASVPNFTINWAAQSPPANQPESTPVQDALSDLLQQELPAPTPPPAPRTGSRN